MPYGEVLLLLGLIAEMSDDGVFWTVLTFVLDPRRMIPNEARFQCSACIYQCLRQPSVTQLFSSPRIMESPQALLVLLQKDPSVARQDAMATLRCRCWASASQRESRR